MSGLATLVLSAIVGVLGGLASYYLTLRRERWNLKRDLYTRLLENLGEIRYTLSRILEATVVPDEENIRAEVSMGGRKTRALDEIRRAHYVAEIMLRKDAIQGLENLYSEMAKAAYEKTAENFVSAQLEAAKKAYRILVNAAKQDLKM